MNSAEKLPTHLTMPPKGLLRKAGLWGVNHLLNFKGLKLPPDFPLHARVGVLRKETEPNVRNLCSRILREGMTAMDVGANVGLLTRHFCRLVGKTGKVFAFEPDPLTFRFLEFNTRSFANKELTQCAISDNHEPAFLHRNPVSSTGSSLLNKAGSIQSINVPCTSVDEFLENHGEPAVDVIKIDVEGAELNVLRGMRQTFLRLPALKIIIEYCPHNLKNSNIVPQMVLDELRTHGFRLQIIQGNGRLKTLEGLDVPQHEFNSCGFVDLFCIRE